MKKEFSQNLGFFALFLCIVATLLALGSIIYFIALRGFGVLSWNFLTQVPYSAMTKGGIAPVIVGTLYITLGAILFALPLGLACAIYLCEYSPKSIVVNIIRISINNLAGVPSVVFGLFGLAVFVKFFGFYYFRKSYFRNSCFAHDYFIGTGSAFSCSPVNQRGFIVSGRNKMGND
jgi:phosphate transport system permease protein